MFNAPCLGVQEITNFPELGLWWRKLRADFIAEYLYQEGKAYCILKYLQISIIFYRGKINLVSVSQGMVELSSSCSHSLIREIFISVPGLWIVMELL